MMIPVVTFEEIHRRDFTKVSPVTSHLCYSFTVTKTEATSSEIAQNT